MSISSPRRIVCLSLDQTLLQICLPFLTNFCPLNLHHICIMPAVLQLNPAMSSWLVVHFLTFFISFGC